MFKHKDRVRVKQVYSFQEALGVKVGDVGTVDESVMVAEENPIVVLDSGVRVCLCSKQIEKQITLKPRKQPQEGIYYKRLKEYFRSIRNENES